MAGRFAYSGIPESEGRMKKLRDLIPLRIMTKGQLEKIRMEFADSAFRQARASVQEHERMLDDIMKRVMPAIQTAVSKLGPDVQGTALNLDLAYRMKISLLAAVTSQEPDNLIEIALRQMLEYVYRDLSLALRKERAKIGLHQR